MARKAALARWDAPELPRATHEGKFKIGERSVSAAVLPNGLRLLTQATFLRAIGRSRSPKKGTGVLSTVDGIPFFLQSNILQPFTDDDLIVSTTPVFYRTRGGRKSVGYDARVLPRVANVYLKMADSHREQGKQVPRQYRHIVRACDALVRGLAEVGILALVDEATGYQEVRDRLALQRILDQYLRAEFATWAKRFPDEFYQEMFRLKGWNWRGMRVNRPQVVGHYTNDVIYDRLAPGVLDELRRKNPRNAKGNRRQRHHQWLTEEVGHPALAQHLYGVIGLMRLADDWEGFKHMLDRAYPKKKDVEQFEIFTTSGLPSVPA